MVVGYGWGDEHVNDPIADAVLNHGVQEYSWDRSHHKDLLKGKHRGDDILRGVSGFMTRPMTEVMPPNPMTPDTADYTSLVRDLF